MIVLYAHKLLKVLNNAQDVVTCSVLPALMIILIKTSINSYNIRSCPNRCGIDINNMSSRALINIYRELDIKCLKCPKVIKVGDIEKH